jgi:T5SS/PEP-CTERM-associated repeat protein
LCDYAKETGKMKSQAWGWWIAVALTSCLGLSALPSFATTATWTSTANGTVEAWTNAANWNAAQYPGQDGVYQHAYLTNRVAGSAYKAVVDTSLPYAVGTVEIKNLGAGGEAWAIVTNAVLTYTNLFIRANGRLQVDSGGIVTNAPTLANNFNFTMDGTNGLIAINSGGSLIALTNSFVGTGSGGKSNVLVLGDNAWLSINYGSLTVGNAAGASFNRLLATNNNARLRTYSAPGIGNNSTLNEALFSGGNTVWDCSGSRFYLGSGGVSNLMTVSQGSLWVTNCIAGFWVGYSTGNGYNRLVVTNSGRLFLHGGLAIGYYGIGSNTVTVTGADSLLDCNSYLVRAGDGGGLNNVMLVDQASTVSNAYVYVGQTAPASGNSLILTNGAKWWNGTATSGSIVGNTCTNNSVVVTGPGTLWDLNPRSLSVGNNAAGVNNTMRIENGGLVTNVNALTVGGNGGSSNRLTIASGGRCYLSIAASLSVGSTGASSNFVSVSGADSALSSLGNLTNGNIYVGSTGATGSVMVVDNGATSTGWNQIYVPRYGNCIGNVLTITNGGYLQGAQVRVAHQGSNTWNNTLQVVDGGILEVGQNGLVVDQLPAGPCGNNTITNKGGVYQFTYVSPVITPVPANSSYIYLTDGTISFRGVTTVNVKGNWSGTLTNISFSGKNAFRLNCATNATSPDQSYTFADNLGPTNYARLELYNGSLYRGGSVTIGSGGTLALSGTPSAITNLTIASGGALETTFSGTNSLSQLVATGSVALGGTLRLVLNAPPPEGFDWTLISKTSTGSMTGAFAGDSVIAQPYLGTNYLFRVDTSSGNTLVLHSLGRSLPGTVLTIL